MGSPLIFKLVLTSIGHPVITIHFSNSCLIPLRDPLSVLDEELRSQMIMDDKTIEQLEENKIPRLKEFEIKDIEKVWTSDWFFS